MITISGKALGKKKPLFADWSIPFPPDLGDGDVLRLRDLIARIVRAEVTAFTERQTRQQTLQVLSARSLDQAAARGKITSGGSEVAPQPVDADEAVATAWTAFEDGLYLVVVDGVEQRTLDGMVPLKPDSTVAFVRLVMLAGG